MITRKTFISVMLPKSVPLIFLRCFIFFLVVSVCMIGMRTHAADWVSPSLPETAGNISPYLNTSSTAQTKAGGLNLEGGFSVKSPFTFNIGSLTKVSAICWNGTCKTSWDQVDWIFDRLRLQYLLPVAQESNKYVVLSQSSMLNPVTLTGIAATPKSDVVPGVPTFGVRGTASSGDASNPTAGIAGYAYRAGDYAVRGDVANGAIVAGTPPLNFRTDALAGYFDGDVVVTSDVVLGNAASNSNGIAEICLGDTFPGTCHSSWTPLEGTGVWQKKGFWLSPKTAIPAKSVAMISADGLTAPGAKSAVYVQTDGTTANLSIKGSVKFTQYVVGTPVAVASSVTCGDGICNGSENVNTCEPDCLSSAPNNAEFYLDIMGHPTNPRPPNQQFGWKLPESPAGIVDPRVNGIVVVIRSDGATPTGPDDIGPTGLRRDTAVTDNPFWQISCTEGTLYTVGLYAYSNVPGGRIYARGITTNYGEIECYYYRITHARRCIGGDKNNLPCTSDAYCSASGLTLPGGFPAFCSAES